MKSPLLTDLKKTLKAEAPATPARPRAAPAPKPREEEVLSDEELFARASAGARPVSYDGVAPAPAQRKKPDPGKQLLRAVAEGGPEGPEHLLSDTAALLNPISPEASLEFARSGIQQKVLKRLKQGLMPWQGAVDLHGCTLDQARDAVEQLVSQARRDGIQVIKIVHGKGSTSEKPMLKSCVNGWLRQLNGVLAFVSALPRDGGTGAVYVLLKKPAVSVGEDSDKR
jgi:DNA-nicking Smr family endonuclease